MNSCLAIENGKASLDAGCQGWAQKQYRCSLSARRPETIVWARADLQSIRDRDLSTSLLQSRRIAVDQLNMHGRHRDMPKFHACSLDAFVFTDDQSKTVATDSEREGEIP